MKPILPLVAVGCALAVPVGLWPGSDDLLPPPGAPARLAPQASAPEPDLGPPPALLARVPASREDAPAPPAAAAVAPAGGAPPAAALAPEAASPPVAAQASGGSSLVAELAAEEDPKALRLLAEDLRGQAKGLGAAALEQLVDLSREGSRDQRRQALVVLAACPPTKALLDGTALAWEDNPSQDLRPAMTSLLQAWSQRAGLKEQVLAAALRLGLELNR